MHTRYRSPRPSRARNLALRGWVALLLVLAPAAGAQSPAADSSPRALLAVADSLIAAGEDSLAVPSLRLAGEALQASGLAAEARRTWSRALELAGAAGSLPQVRALLALLQEASFDAGDREEALRFGERLVNLPPGVLSPEALARILCRQGEIRLELGHPEAAVGDLTRADTLLTGSTEPALQARIHLARAEALLRTGQARESVETVRKALALEEHLKPERLVAARELEISALVGSGALAAADSVLASVFGESPTRPSLETAARLRMAARDTAGAWVLAERASLVSEAGEGNLPTGRPAWAPPPPYPDAADLPDLSRRLDEIHGALLQFTSGNLGTPVVFLLDGRGLHARALAGFPGLEILARETFTRLESGDPLEPRRDALHRLSEGLLASFIDDLPPEVTRILVIPPPSLAGFPFEVLPIAGPEGAEAQLGSRYAVSYLPNAGALRTLTKRRPSEVGMLVFARPRIPAPDAADSDPAASNPAPDPIDDASPAAEIEAVRIPAALVFTGAEASRARLLTPTAALQGVIYLGAPAVANASHPRESALTLAGHPGTLDLATLESLPLQADLVTLTGVSTVPEREPGSVHDLFPRALLTAGARSVLANRWNPDASGRERLLELLHDHLGKGRARDESLRRARVTMIAEGASPRDYLALALHGPGQLPVTAIAAYPSPWPALWGLLAALVTGGALTALVRARKRRRPAPRPPRVMPPPTEPEWDQDWDPLP